MYKCLVCHGYSHNRDSVDCCNYGKTLAGAQKDAHLARRDAKNLHSYVLDLQGQIMSYEEQLGVPPEKSFLKWKKVVKSEEGN